MTSTPGRIRRAANVYLTASEGRSRPILVFSWSRGDGRPDESKAGRCPCLKSDAGRLTFRRTRVAMNAGADPTAGCALLLARSTTRPGGARRRDGRKGPIPLQSGRRETVAAIVQARALWA